MLNGRLERPAGLWIQQKLSGLKCQREKKKKRWEKKNISRIASSNPDELSQQMLTGREKTPKREREREKGRRQSGNAVVNIVYCDD